MTPEEYAAHLRRLVDSAPPLRQAQKDRLAVALRGDDDRTPRRSA